MKLSEKSLSPFFIVDVYFRRLSLISCLRRLLFMIFILPLFFSLENEKKKKTFLISLITCRVDENHEFYNLCYASNDLYLLIYPALNTLSDSHPIARNDMLSIVLE